MRTNPNDAAFGGSAGYYGLTKLEYFSALAMQGFTASTEGSYSSKNLAKDSVCIAKALIDELNKQDEENKNYETNQTNS